MLYSLSSLRAVGSKVGKLISQKLRKVFGYGLIQLICIAIDLFLQILVNPGEFLYNLNRRIALRLVLQLVFSLTEEVGNYVSIVIACLLWLAEDILVASNLQRLSGEELGTFIV